MNRKGAKRKAPRGGAPRSGKRPQLPGRKPTAAAKKRVAPAPPPVILPTLQLGFVRGVAPSKWADRWARSVREQPLEIVPVGLHGVAAARADLDVLLERVAPGGTPPGSEESGRTRHAMQLYQETVALVVTLDHELADRTEVDLADLALVPLLAHPDHFPEWPQPQPWRDPAWMPPHAKATLQLVATGVGGALMAQPLARHLSDKRTHAVIPVTRSGESLLPGTEIWATWRVDRDDTDVQRLVGVLRGRTARSSR